MVKINQKNSGSNCRHLDASSNSRIYSSSYVHHQKLWRANLTLQLLNKSQTSSWCSHPPQPWSPPLPPTVNGPITVALVGKLSQIVGNLQFMMFPQITPSGTCFPEKFSQFWDSQKLDRSFSKLWEKKPGSGLFYDLRGWTGHILRPLYIIQHRSLWPLYITHTKLLNFGVCHKTYSSLTKVKVLTFFQFLTYLHSLSQVNISSK